MKKYIFIVVFILIGSGSVAFFHFNRSPKKEKQKYQSVTVERGAIRSIIASTGRVVANLEVNIKCKASGEITKIPFDISDSVKVADLLAELDPTDEERNVKQAQVSLQASQAKLNQAKIELSIAEKNIKTEQKQAKNELRFAQVKANDAQAKAKRVEHLLKKKLAGQEEYDTAKTAATQALTILENAKLTLDEIKTKELNLDLKRQDVILAQTQVDANQISLSTAQQRLKDTKIISPINGVITAREIQVGQIISSGINNVGGGTTLLNIADLSRIFVLAYVDESDIGQVNLDLPVTISVDAYPKTHFKGKVVRIATQGDNVSNVVTFEVKIEILGEKKTLLKPEMSANVEIIIAESENILIVPVESVFRKKRKKIVRLLKEDGTIKEQPVKTGISDGVNIEIIEGLQDGNKILFSEEDVDDRWRRKEERVKTRTQGMILGGGKSRR